jgi:hypothetical protein
MRAMYSSSSFATHHIFFPPRLQVVAFQQDPDRLSPHPRHQFAPDGFFGQQAHRPARPTLWRRRAGHGDDALPLLKLVRKKMGVLGMKSMANGIILKSQTVTPTECLNYALNLPTSVVITGIDSIEILEQALEAWRTFRPLGEAEVKALLAKTEKAAKSGEFEPFKTTSIIDSTAQNPAWLGEEPEHVQQLMPME